MSELIYYLVGVAFGVLICFATLHDRPPQPAVRPQLNDLTLCFEDEDTPGHYIATDCSTGEQFEQLFLINNVWTVVKYIHVDYSHIKNPVNTP